MLGQIAHKASAAMTAVRSVSPKAKMIGTLGLLGAILVTVVATTDGQSPRQTATNDHATPLLMSVPNLVPLAPAETAAIAQPSPQITTPVNYTCEGAIGTALSTLQSRLDADKALLWHDARSDITDVVKQIIDCPASTFQVQGDLELAALGQADVAVQWNTTARRLTLTTITQNSGMSEGSDDSALRFTIYSQTRDAT